MGRRRRGVPLYWLSFVVVRACIAHAWSCSVSVDGTPSSESTITECSVLCRDGPDEASSLPVMVHPVLTGCTFSGVTPNFISSLETIKPGLIVFKNAHNVTLEDSRLINIQGLDLECIVTFTSCTNVTVSNLTSSGCQAQQILSSINTPQDPSSLFLVQSSSFASSVSGGIYVTYHDLAVRDTVFDGLIASVNSSVAAALQHDNSDGGFTSIEHCTFSHTQNLGTYGSSTVGISRPNLLISRSRFINCTATYAIVNIMNLPLLDGGYPANGTATVEGCTFQETSASQSCLYMIGKEYSLNEQLNLYNSRFVGNTGNYGSAVTTFAVGTVQVVACVFESNFASHGLSALYVYGGVQQLTYFTMRDSVFRNNNGTRSALTSTADTGITDTAECGGAYLSSCKCVGITHSIFENNVGKGLCIHGQIGSSPDCYHSDPVLFNKTTIAGPANKLFLDNFLDRYEDLVISVDIRHSRFTNNTDAFLTRTTAEPEDVQPIDYLTGGAGLAIQNVLFTVLSSNTFSSNRGRQGSGLHLDTCFVTYVWNSTFDGNTATGQGGALAVVNTHSKGLLVANSTFRNSQALFGGAVYADVGAAMTFSNGSQLVHNRASTGGAVFCDNCQRLVLEMHTEMSFNTADMGGGAVYCDGCVLLTATDVLMTHNSCGGPGGALAIYGNGYTLGNISTSAFESNTAMPTQALSPVELTAADGGAIDIEGGVMVLTQNNFVNNTADGHGGAVAYTDQCFTVTDTSGALVFLWAQLAPDLAALAGNCSYFISTANAFSGNHANIAGGVIYSSNVNSMRLACTTAQEDHSPSLDCLDWSSSSSSMFPANTVGASGIVGYGPGLAFPPAAVVFSSSGNSSMGMRYISDGSTDVPVPTINVLDQAGNKVKAQPLRANVTVTTVLAKGGLMPQLPGQTEARGDANGDINIAELLLIASPGMYDLQLALPDFPQVPAAILQIDVQPCGLGQVPTQDGNQCIACPSASYSFDPASGACKPCPAQGICSGGATLVPQQQHWHSAPDSDHIVTCPNSNACAGSTSELLACQNATYQAQLDFTQDTPAEPACTLDDPWTSANPKSYMRQLCAPGYHGPVCSMCISSGEVTFGRVGALQCQPCRRTVSIISAYIASALLVLAWLSYTIHVTLVENEEAAAGHDDPQCTSQLIRALNLWLQYITLLGSINIPAPSTVQWIFSAAQFAFATVTSGSLSTDCLLSGPVNHALQRMLIHLTVPVLVFTVLAAIQLLRWWRSNSKNPSTPSGLPPTPFSAALHTSSSAELKRRLLITLLEVVFFYYPSLLTTTLSLFACFHIDPAGAAADQYHHAQANWRFGYWVPDMSVQCFTGWHRKLAIILGTPLMTLTWVVIPLMPVFLLFRHRHNLHAPKVQLQLGYIYRIYRSELWFWNSIVLVLTLALTASQVFATALDTYFQLAIMLMILMIGLTALAHFRPFTNNLLQRMQVLGIFTVQVTATGCLYFLDPTNVANTAGLTAVGIALLVLNIGYVVAMLLLIVIFGAAKTKHFTRQAFAALRTSSVKLRHSMSGFKMSNSFTVRPSVSGRSSTDSQAAFLGGGKVLSLMPSSLSDSSSSSPVVLSADDAKTTAAQQMPTDMT